MAMADRRWQRTATLCALYVAQGVPWGFMAITIVSYLTERGVKEAAAGALTGVVLLPWAFKLVWAPLIDSVTFRSMGRRRAWIIGAQMMMALTLLGIIALGDITQNLTLLGGMFFLHNCFASLQDICTDALAMDVLPVSEHGTANGLMFASKLLGRGIGAAVLAWVIDQWGITASVLVQFVLLLLIMLFPIFILERKGEKRFPWSKGEAVFADAVQSVRSPKTIFHDLIKAFSLPTTLVFAVFILLKLVGYGVNEVVTKTLYTQELGWKFRELSVVGGFYAIVPSILGAYGGGYLSNRFGRRLIIAIGFGGYGLLAIVFALSPALWVQRWFTTTYLLASVFFYAVGTVGSLSMAMRVCWTKSSATMFALYMTLSNFGHVAGNWVVGPVRARLDFGPTILLVGIATLLPLLLLKFVDPEVVGRRKTPETETGPGIHELDDV